MMTFDSVVNQIDSVVWSTALVVISMAGGLLFSVMTRFVQVRRLKTMFRLLFSNDKEKKTGVSSFQAFAIALSGRVGTGNIVGVATAIAFGGPGAIVWMWIIAFVGASSAFVESTLAQIYKVKDGSQFRGGPSYYITKGLHSKWLAVIFAVCAVIACGFLLPSVQANGVADSFSGYAVSPWLIGFALATLLGFVIIGGVKRIAQVAGFVAPLMAIIYLVVAVIILFSHVSLIPHTFKLMLTSAIGVNPIFGGIIGSTIMMGVKRGIFSNEAGQGTGAIVSAAAKVSHPVKQGMVQAFSVYVDTLLVCTATAVMLLATNMYNVYDPSGQPIVNHVPYLGQHFVLYTQAAIDSILHGFGNLFVPVALIFFVFTTLMAYYYYAETSLAFLFTNKDWQKVFIWILRAMILAAVVFGAVKEAKVAWDLGDIGVGLMAWINFIALFFLFPKAIKALKDYERQEREGKDPEFHPKELGIEDADYWEEND